MAKNFDRVMKSKNLGSGLLSENSRQFAVNEFKVTYIPLEQLVSNPRNEGFTMDDIEELKTSIREVGLEQNLVVVPDGAKFRILTGHRRYLALKALFDEGLEKFRTVPCIVKDLSKIDLPLSEDSKELYAIATTNLENRRCSDADKLKLMAMLSQVYDELKANGYDRLGKRRDFLADRLGISSAGVQILSYVDKNIAEPFRDAFTNESLPLMVLSEIAHLSPDDQAALHEELLRHPNPNLSVKDVRAFAQLRVAAAARDADKEAAAAPRKPHTAPKSAPAAEETGGRETISANFFAPLETALASVVAKCRALPPVSMKDSAQLYKLQSELTGRLRDAEQILQKYQPAESAQQ